MDAGQSCYNGQKLGEAGMQYILQVTRLQQGIRSHYETGFSADKRERAWPKLWEMILRLQITPEVQTDEAVSLVLFEDNSIIATIQIK